MPKVLVFKETILPPSETFIIAQMRSLRRYTPSFVGLEPTPRSLPLDSTPLLLSSQPTKIADFRSKIYRRIGIAPLFHERVKALHVDLIHAHFACGGQTILPLRRKLKVPLVVSLHGGSYVVARENFGPRIAQICAVALLIDYIVTVAVQTAAGTAAVASAFPSIGPYKLEITVGVVLLMAFGNLRGLREAGRAFAVPTYVVSGSRRPAALQPPHRLRLRGQLRPGHAALRAEHAAHHDPRGALRHRQRPRRQAHGQGDPRRARPYGPPARTN